MENRAVRPPMGLEIVVAAFDSFAATAAFVRLHSFPPHAGVLFLGSKPFRQHTRAFVIGRGVHVVPAAGRA
jgi:hypothetical protein